MNNNIRITGPGIAEVKSRDLLKDPKVKQQYQAMKRLKERRIGFFKRNN